MGFWHTGYMEFHEPVGFEQNYAPIPPAYRCQHCGASFDNPAALRTHRFERHPFTRPVLFVNGIEVGTTPISIIRRIKTHDVLVGHCEAAWLNDRKVSRADIGKKLAAITDDTVHIRLYNAGVSAEFTLKIEIAEEADIDGVDRSFFNVARIGRLDRRAIEEFISSSRHYPSAIRYADGICDYFYGVLAKEKSQESSLAYDAYREKFTQAADALKDFNRPLARTISALIAYHFNNFSEAAALAQSSRVGAASQRFSCWLEGDASRAKELGSQFFDDSLERLLTDLDTERLLYWSVATNEVLLPRLQDMESMIRQDIAEFDRSKLHILLSEFHDQTGNGQNAKHHARELRSSVTFGPWAERILDRLSNKGQTDV